MAFNMECHLMSHSYLYKRINSYIFDILIYVIIEMTCFNIKTQIFLFSDQNNNIKVLRQLIVSEN